MIFEFLRDTQLRLVFMTGWFFSTARHDIIYTWGSYSGALPVWEKSLQYSERQH